MRRLRSLGWGIGADRQPTRSVPKREMVLFSTIFSILRLGLLVKHWLGEAAAKAEVRSKE